mmetsp:Transcript_27807/g.60840  ORF Transcript_27807/g.60840 Transcript_27807/m.60840 type:complete len:283 (-) Transcript_27807:33-881(-)
MMATTAVLPFQMMENVAGFILLSTMKAMLSLNVYRTAGTAYTIFRGGISSGVPSLSLTPASVYKYTSTALMVFAMLVRNTRAAVESAVPDRIDPAMQRPPADIRKASKITRTTLSQFFRRRCSMAWPGSSEGCPPAMLKPNRKFNTRTLMMRVLRGFHTYRQMPIDSHPILATRQLATFHVKTSSQAGERYTAFPLPLSLTPLYSVTAAALPLAPTLLESKGVGSNSPLYLRTIYPTQLVLFYAGPCAGQLRPRRSEGRAPRQGTMHTSLTKLLNMERQFMS